MKKTRRKFEGAFKAQVAIEALKERETLSELALKYDLHPNQISQWKQEFVEKSASVFENKSTFVSDKEAVDATELYAKIGELQMERDFLKKSLRKLGIL
ncbi:MAG: transposase [Candidatus Saccharimonadales bacterium]